MYCMLALSTPHCPGHTVYTHHTQPMQGPGGALRCLEVHWAIIVIRCTAYLEAASPPCPLPIRCSTVLRCGFIPTDCDLLIMLIMMSELSWPELWVPVAGWLGILSPLCY